METKEPTPTIVHNYYGITFQNCSMPNATIQTISQPSADAQPAPAARAPEDTLSDALRTPRAEALLARLVDAGLVDASWQPLSLSNAEKGVLASLLADRLHLSTPDRLGVDNLWQTFGRLWGMKPENLRSAYNKGMDQPRSNAFIQRVNRALEE